MITTVITVLKVAGYQLPVFSTRSAEREWMHSYTCGILQLNGEMRIRTVEFLGFLCDNLLVDIKLHWARNWCVCVLLIVKRSKTSSNLGYFKPWLSICGWFLLKWVRESSCNPVSWQTCEDSSTQQEVVILVMWLWSEDRDEILSFTFLT